MNITSLPFARRAAAVALGAVVGLAAIPAYAQSAATVQIKHASGTTAVPAAPKKLIVLDATALDILAALDVKVAGVPSNPLPRHLARYNDPKIQRVGTLFEPNYEAIHSAAPDLIIVGGRSQAKYADVAKIAPTIDLTADRTDLVGSVEHNTNTLAALFGKEAQAKQLLGKLHKSIDDLKAKASTAGTGLIVLTTGGKMSAYGPGSRFGVLHDAFGIKPAAAKLNTSNHGQAISFEFILKTNPDWLFVIDRDAAIGREGASGQRLLDNELVRQTKAWKNQRVVYLDGLNWYTLGGAGLTAMQENVDQLARALSGAK
jgi:iron complex transport system substrate-binding protein